MEIVSAIGEALAIGAAAGAQNVASDAVSAAWHGLKSLLAGRLTSLANLEEDPTDEAYRKAAEAELRKKGLAEDPAILEKARELLAAIEREPEERLVPVGIDLCSLRAAKGVLIKDLESRQGGIRIRDVEARDGDVTIEQLRTGGSEKN